MCHAGRAGSVAVSVTDAAARCLGAGSSQTSRMLRGGGAGSAVLVAAAECLWSFLKLSWFLSICVHTHIL